MLKKKRNRWAKELYFRQGGFRLIAGVDEAGRGALAGPVVAAAVILPEDFDHPDINDSKELSPPKREQLYEIIIEKALAYAVASASSQEIDEKGILKATLSTMAKALEALTLVPQLALIDGQFTTPWRGIQKAIVDGDACCLSVAAASIIAKVSRDKLMEEAHKDFPNYNFLKNKGYGTKTHLEALKRYGPCPIHRLSFKPVAKTYQLKRSWSSSREVSQNLFANQRI